MSANIPNGAKIENASGNGSMPIAVPARIKKTYQFWKDVFIALGEDVFTDKNTTTMQFARAVPNEPIDTLPALKVRKVLLDTGTDKKFKDLELQFLIKTSGCLVSLAGIAAFIKSDIEKIFDDLKSLETAASEHDISKIDLKAVNRGIRASRELSDLVRKLSYCKKIGKEFSIDYYEVLALYRQEGALALTPFKESYDFGTLIATETDRCRSPDMAVRVASVVNLKRPGFNLSYSTKLTGLNDKSYSLFMIFANLLATSGLDILFKNHPFTGDEISQLFRHGKAVVISHFKNQFNASIFKIDNVEGLHLKFEMVIIGLAMFVLESDSHHKKNIPSIESIFDQVFDLLKNLFASHQVQATVNKKLPKLKNMCLVGSSAQPDTFLCLKIQAMWYSTRKYPYTLLALKDRTIEFKKLPPFSPFVTYMRFHADELIFLGIVIRFLRKFEALKNFWKGRSSPVKPPATVVFPDLKAVEATIEHSFNEIKIIKDDSIKNPVKTWVSLGLVEHYAGKKSLPEWFAPADLDPSFKDFKQRADQALIAKKMLTIINTYNLVDTLNFVMEFTPIKSLFEDTRVFANARDDEKRLFMSRVFTKAHSFERVRLVYENADRHPVLSTEKKGSEKK